MTVSPLTLLQDEAHQLRVAVLGGYVQRRAAGRVSDQEADASTHTVRQLDTHTQKREDSLTHLSLICSFGL